MRIYDRIADFQERLPDAWKDQFVEEPALHADMMELLLTPLEWSRQSSKPVDPHSAAVLLLSRTFNDFEASRQLLMIGLLEQVMYPMRDAVECALLLHVMAYDQPLADKWLNDMKQYKPSEARRVLEKLGSETAGYLIYDSLTYHAHPNMLASVARVQETELVGDKFWRAVHFGGFRNIAWARLQWQMLLTVELSVLWGAIAAAYRAANLFTPAAADFWEQSLINFHDRYSKLFPGSVEQDEPVDQNIARKIRSKLKIHAVTWDKRVIQEGEPPP